MTRWKRKAERLGEALAEAQRSAESQAEMWKTRRSNESSV